MESDLGPDPSDTANALLTQLLQIGLGNFSQTVALGMGLIWDEVCVALEPYDTAVVGPQTLSDVTSLLSGS